MQDVVSDQPILFPQKGVRPMQIGASRMPSRGDSAADTALDKAITPALLQTVSKSAENGMW